MWKRAVVLAIGVSCVCLAYDNPSLDPDSALASRLALANVGLTLCFAVEAALKIVAYGFACREHAYLHNGWNRLDFVVPSSPRLAL